ncbi:hypothetical protein AMS68_004392 [Peltaster fructicola]|uniref:Uncharacterized protein n=1 Tax=Peltaster fructicola TaxID=286661 RepID=A0A6H0XW40_9PEZI|nr:hypothetical protein AMS68_004392 [Peltaster fructicola]
MPNPLCVTGEEPVIDNILLQHLKEEGFDVTYVSFISDRAAYRETMKSIGKEIGRAHPYGIIAFGDAATECLDMHVKPGTNLTAIVAYYPSGVRRPTARYRTNNQGPVHLLCHLASKQDIKIAFKSNTTKSHAYTSVEPGFAQRAKSEFNEAASTLAWSRTLSHLRRAYKMEEIETVWQRHFDLMTIATHDDDGDDKYAIFDTMTSDYLSSNCGALDEESAACLPCSFGVHNADAWSISSMSRDITGTVLTELIEVTTWHSPTGSMAQPRGPAASKQVITPVKITARFRDGKVCFEKWCWRNTALLHAQTPKK